MDVFLSLATPHPVSICRTTGEDPPQVGFLLEEGSMEPGSLEPVIYLYAKAGGNFVLRLPTKVHSVTKVS